MPSAVVMGASDATSGLATSALTVSCGGSVRAATTRQASSASLTVQIDRHDCTLTGKATDEVGNRASRQLTPNVRLYDLRRSTARADFAGGWKIVGSKDSLGRTLARTSARGATVRLRFEGAQFAVVAKRGPSGGRFKVIVDGKHVDTIDLYAGTGTKRRVVYVRNVTKEPHVVKLRATGTKRPKSSGTRVWLDAVLVLDRRK